MNEANDHPGTAFLGPGTAPRQLPFIYYYIYILKIYFRIFIYVSTHKVPVEVRRGHRIHRDRVRGERAI